MLCVHGSRADYFDFKTNQDSVTHSFTHPDQGASGEKKKFTYFGKLTYMCVHTCVFLISKFQISTFNLTVNSRPEFYFIAIFMRSLFFLNDFIYAENIFIFAQLIGISLQIEFNWQMFVAIFKTCFYKVTIVRKRVESGRPNPRTNKQDIFFSLAFIPENTVICKKI